jgi:hypothetical protein
LILKMDILRRQIRAIPTEKTVTINMQSAVVGNDAQAAAGGYAYDWLNPTARATGGSASGWTMVGENGPEMVDLPGGSNVATANGTRELLQGAGRSGPSADEIGAAVARAMRSELQNAGLGW